MAEEAQTVQIPIWYEKEEGYRLVPANGIYGGVSPKGDVVIHFFMDHNAIPEKTYFEQVEGEVPGTASLTEVHPQNPGIVRKLQFGAVITAMEARSIGKWLMEKATQVLGPEGGGGND